MGLMQGILGMIFGGDRNVIAETAQVFRPNAENQAAREANYQSAALAQLASEFAVERRGWFDRFMDGLNRLPRPAMVIGTLALISSAMYDPIWFAERMVGLALVPEPLWWIFGAIVTFYFGARTQAKSQDFQKSIAATMTRTPQVVESIADLRELRADSPGVADTIDEPELTVEVIKEAIPDEAVATVGNMDGVMKPGETIQPSGNAAVDDWRRTR